MKRWTVKTGDIIAAVLCTIVCSAIALSKNAALGASVFVAMTAACVFLCVKRKVDMTQVLLQKNATAKGTLKHVEGLPIAPGTIVDVFDCHDKFVFKKEHQEFTVAKSKVTDVECTTGQNIKSQAMSGAAAGKIVFGGITGAVIGSLASMTTYLVISYTSNNERKFVILDTYASGTFAMKVKKNFTAAGITPTTVEL